jgi:hypothetical protein
MAFVLVGDVYRITTYVRFDDRQNQLNVHYYKCTGSIGTGIVDQDAMNGVMGVLSGLYNPLIPTLSKFHGTKWAKDGAVLLAEGLSISTVSSGGRTGDSLPPQVCAVISQRASGAPIGKRGRYYMPSPTEGDSNAEAELTTDYRASLTNFAAAMLFLSTVVSGAGKSTSWQKQLRYKTLGAIAYQDVTLSIVRNNFGTQRRRSTINRADAPLV